MRLTSAIKNLIWNYFFVTPISNISNKNYLKIFGVPIVTTQITMMEMTRSFRYAIYLDSKDVNTLVHVMKWFESGFFSKSETVVILRGYVRGFFSFERFFDENSIQFVAYNKYSSISISDFDFIFYPFNTNTNQIIMKNRNVIHVFIGHGESDKLASVNPMIRMYDHVFVSGDVSIERLTRNKLVTEYDVINGKCVKIGVPYISCNTAGESLTTANVQGVLYAPTWEGADINQAYSSLLIATDLIENMLSRGLTVYFQPHPSTGIRTPAYKEKIDSILSQFARKDCFVYIDNSSDNIFSANERFGKFGPCYYNTIVTDISSMVMLGFVHQKNTFVYVSDYHLELLEKELLITSRSDIVFSSTKEFLRIETDYFTRPPALDVSPLVSVENYFDNLDYSDFISTFKSVLEDDIYSNGCFS
ncbi:hypothetical protein [Vibrio panuliri]|uniref:hypothetical protein n=3 Tax=Vibrio panuliri TaxID=1381081 RepID=UPI00124918AD|nr:hypothetical protein [Vibrio panuliri]KAB1457286.1 hypothetical protein F7O85_05985 [Vibrio panuliri]